MTTTQIDKLLKPFGWLVLTTVAGLIAAFILGATGALWIGVTETPELMGNANAVMLRGGESLVGLMWDENAVFVVHGSGEVRVQCELKQVWGIEYGRYESDGEDIPCLIVWRESGKFRGWIDWRNVGRNRAFCGAPSAGQLPEVCMWR